MATEDAVVNANLAMIRDTLACLAEPRQGSEGIYVPTTTLLPGGDLVGVMVSREGDDRFRVSDNGAGREAILDAGVVTIVPADRRRANEIAGLGGLEVEGDSFVIRGVGADQLAAAVIYVADASRAWAQSVLDRESRRRERDVSETVQRKLELAFTPARVTREVTLLGASSSQHRFDFVVDLAGERRALFEIVTPAPASISSTHLKFFDLEREHHDWPREAVVESMADWNASSLALLNQVATHVRPILGEWSDLPALAA